jgi:hypothetical protein
MRLRKHVEENSLEGPMAKSDSGRAAVATHDDIRGILGELDPPQLLAIMALRPTVMDLEQVSLWLGGDADVFEPGPPLKGVASEILTILTENEEEEPPRAG